MKKERTSVMPQTRAGVSRYVKELRKVILGASVKHQPAGPNGKLLVENWRLLATALADCADSAKILTTAGDQQKSGADRGLRVFEVARQYLEEVSTPFDPQTFSAFVVDQQNRSGNALWMDEVWSLKTALQLLLLERVARGMEGGAVDIRHAVTSLRHISSAEWREVFSKINAIDPILGEDPAGVFANMDFDSKDVYRERITKLAKRSNHSEVEIARMALTLARQAFEEFHSDQRVHERRSHIGYYLIDDGYATLRTMAGYRAGPADWVPNFVLRFPNAFYMIGVELATLFLVFWICSEMGSPRPLVGVLAFLIIPATHAAVHFMNTLSGLVVKPRVLPRLDFSEGIPEEYSTAVAVPVLLLNENQVRTLVRDLRIRYLANTDPQLCYVLLSDSPDSAQAFDEKDNLVELAQQLIEDLNAEYGSRFYLLHRHRSFNASEGKWMGWERKRGKLIDFNQYLRNAWNPFPVAVGDIERLRSVRFVITLDADTQLPRGTAARLIGTLAHPLNRAVIDPSTNMVVEGYGILQPRVGVSIQSASKSWLANIYSGQTGFDIYTRAISDVYQDLFGEAIFTGKGIYDVDVFRTVLEKRFPNNTLLSHDLIEGAYVRAGLVTDTELVDDFPSHFSAYCRRQHRWVRGDWQVMRWLLPVVPDYNGTPIFNPISLLSAWKIADNLRRSLIHPAALALLLAGWFWFSGSPVGWTLASLGLFLIPAVSQFVFTLLRFPKTGIKAFLKEVVASFFKDCFMAILQFVFLIHQTLLSLDAIVRSLSRTMKGKKLLEWETAAESEAARKKAPVDTYLELTPFIAMLIGVLVAAFHPTSLYAAIPVLALWLFSRSISNWLNAQPEPADDQVPETEEQKLRAEGLRTWRFFAEFSNESNHWLIPDNVRQDGLTPANRISPTNLGMLLNARQAAVEMGWLTVDEFADLTKRTIESTLKMERHQGHLLNWYSTDDLSVLPPAFVSSVDSGNLAASLWTLKQGSLKFTRQQLSNDLLLTGIQDHITLICELEPKAARGLTGFCAKLVNGVHVEELEELDRQATLLLNDESIDHEARWWASALRQRISAMRSPVSEKTSGTLNWIAQASHRLVEEMNFAFLYLPAKRALSVGFNVGEEKLFEAAYDVLASEARSAVFIAIAKGDIPQQAWFNMSRSHTLAFGRKVLVSWSGTMFEYLMPMLWMRHYPDTLLARSSREIVTAQQRFGRHHNMPWGISECAFGYGDQNCEYSYQAFGLPHAALNPEISEPQVVAPYATFLALPVDAKEALRNLTRMRKMGLRGTFGFYEAADYSPSRADIRTPYSIVRVWMAHHQAMSLLALCNFSRGNVIQDYFHDEPTVEATERILQERAPRDVRIDAIQSEVLPQLMPEAATSTAA